MAILPAFITRWDIIYMDKLEQKKTADSCNSFLEMAAYKEFHSPYKFLHT